jgi:phenylalanyl-tRNA synthetase beta chain
MKFSTNTLQHYQQKWQWSDELIPNGVDALVQVIGRQLGAVEEIEQLGAKLTGAIVVRVVSCDKLEDSDHLNVCRIDDGGTAKDVERGEDGYVQVVCGAPNVHAGMSVVWLPPGSTVPETIGKEPFVLGARKLRGVMSNGMLASLQELALGEDHSGIVELSDKINPGTYLVDAYKLRDDMLIDIENKMFTHRPDCFGLYGVAREIAGIQGLQFSSPEWYQAEATAPEVQANLPLVVDNQLPDLVPRFTAMTLANVAVGPSPLWLKIELAKVGIKSINNIVDLTNHYMILTGQPLHAYDYDKVKSLSDGDAKLIVRHPGKDETIALLNGKTIKPRDEAVMIATDKQLIGAGGVMGGTDTEVDDNTKNVILECANFDMYSIRRTSMAHGLFTDAVTRFNKGQSITQTRPVIIKTITNMIEIAGGEVASELIDVYPKPYHNPTVEVGADFINARLGLTLTNDDIAWTLRNVEFEVEVGDVLRVTAPFWRTDIHIAEDVVEEVGRLHGFESLPTELPKRPAAPVSYDTLMHFKTTLRKHLSGLGANELLTYSFVPEKLLKNSQQDSSLAFKINNAISPDVQYYRLSITPSLISKVHANIKAGHNEFALYEIGKTHNKMHTNDAEGVPAEYEIVALTYASKKQGQQPAYYTVRRYLDELAKRCQITLTYKPLNEVLEYPVTAPFEPSRSALVSSGDTFIGIIGEYKQSVMKALKLPASSAGFELGINELNSAQTPGSTYRPLSRYPHVSQDICLQVSDDVAYGDLSNHFASELQSQVAQNEAVNWSLLDIYSSDDIAGKKRITFRVQLTNYERTLDDTTLNKVLNEVVAKLGQTHGVERI